MGGADVGVKYWAPGVGLPSDGRVHMLGTNPSAQGGVGYVVVALRDAEPLRCAVEAVVSKTYKVCRATTTPCRE